jgi:hypothetical protein
MNNLTKIAALPTGGGCQSALRPEDRGAERTPAPELQAWQMGMLRALIGKSVTREFFRDVLAGHSGFAIGGLVGSSPDRMLLDTAPIRYGCDLAGEVDTRDQKLGGIQKIWQDDRQVWPEKCRVTVNVEGNVTARTQAQIADSVRRANLKGGAA